jgi:hypothetical protein
MNFEDFDSSQNYIKIKNSHSIENRFVDNIFKANNESVFTSKKFFDFLKNHHAFPDSHSNSIKWIRAKDLYGNKSHFVLNENHQKIDSNSINETNYMNYFKTTDFDQGILGKFFFIILASFFK